MGCLCVLAGREGMSPIPCPLHFVTAVYKVRGTIYLAAVSHSRQIGLVWNLTRSERRMKELLCSERIIP